MLHPVCGDVCVCVCFFCVSCVHRMLLPDAGRATAQTSSNQSPSTATLFLLLLPVLIFIPSPPTPSPPRTPTTTPDPPASPRPHVIPSLPPSPPRPLPSLLPSSRVTLPPFLLLLLLLLLLLMAPPALHPPRLALWCPSRPSITRPSISTRTTMPVRWPWGRGGACWRVRVELCHRS